MYYTYIIQSISDPSQRYIGFTGNSLNRRLAKHNEGTTPATARYRPWRILWAGAFLEKKTALDFETYLKSGSGRAFTAKRLIPSDS
jgi:predicted GIY-YIG superfamily endonuclease